MSKNKKEIKKSTVPIDILFCGLLLGVLANIFILPRFITPSPPLVDIALKNASSHNYSSKKEIIDQILITTGINQSPYSKTYLETIKINIQTKNQKSEILRSEKFWNDFFIKNENAIKKIDEKYNNLSIDFYNQFTLDQLAKYYTLIKLPINTKIMQALSKSMNDNTIETQELRNELLELVSSNLKIPLDNNDY